MPNRLTHEISPYLLQHADNPVQWHPWDQQALQLAVQQDRPILLSIGYSACHWCHVMERECFEDQAIARIMNEHFICIKVDREERPDLDRVYQLSHQILTQRPGGWPLTVALTPHGHAPFFAGTYFPPEPRFHLPGFPDILKQVSDHYHANRGKFGTYVDSFSQALSKLNPTASQAPTTDPDILLRRAESSLQKQYDNTFGGFGDAPKFPHPTQLELLLLGDSCLPQEYGRPCQEMALNTLRHMAQGGLFDQLGGGFFRYSVDREWKIPHFEKMLYDNAQLLCLYCDAWAITGEAFYRRIAVETCFWAQTTMQDGTGGYTATLDADSDGEEGRFYVWSETDLRTILTESHYQALEEYFALYGEPNFEGKWHFNINPQHDPETQQNPQRFKEIQEARAILLQVRDTRTPPAMDDKILTSWNGLMIKGMARTARMLNVPSCAESARQAIDCVRSNLWDGHRLKACFARHKAQLNGYLDDYAFMLEGLLEMLQAEWRTEDATFAVDICNAMLDLFEDPELGGFHFTSHDHETLLCRLKSGADDSIPSGNASAVRSLIILGTLVGNSRYLQSADKALRLFSQETGRQPSVNALMTIASCQASQGTLVVVRADTNDMPAWKQALSNRFQPPINLFCIDKDHKRLPGTLTEKKPGPASVAYVCRGMQCSAPVTSLEDLLQELGA